MSEIEKVQRKIIVLEESLSTVRMQISELTRFYSDVQVKIWRKRRMRINGQLKYYRDKLKTMAG
jgi:hypothetical protein